jgi:hypothetical protein
MRSNLLPEPRSIATAVQNEVYTISKLLHYLVVPLITWEAIVGSSIALMYALAHRKSFDREDGAFFIWAFILGFLVVLLCWPVCRVLRRIPAILTGLCFGLLAPIIAGWFWGQVVEPTRLRDWPNPWSLPLGLNWGGLEAWVAGLWLSIPSAIAGGIVGFLQAKKLAPRVGSQINS